MPSELVWSVSEARKTIAAKERSGFVAKYLSGANILDIGYRGYLEDVVPIVPQAIGVDLNYPGYDGRTLPFARQFTGCSVFQPLPGTYRRL